jgi:hypothetical protein
VPVPDPIPVHVQATLSRDAHRLVIDAPSGGSKALVALAGMLMTHAGMLAQAEREAARPEADDGADRRAWFAHAGHIAAEADRLAVENKALREVMEWARDCAACGAKGVDASFGSPGSLDQRLESIERMLRRALEITATASAPEA